jgi:hypothetical protein
MLQILNVSLLAKVSHFLKLQLRRLLQLLSRHEQVINVKLSDLLADLILSLKLENQLLVLLVVHSEPCHNLYNIGNQVSPAVETTRHQVCDGLLLTIHVGVLCHIETVGRRDCVLNLGSLPFLLRWDRDGEGLVSL